MNAARPLPIVDVATDVFWRHAQDHEIAYEQCTACGEIVFYPRGHCTNCGSLSLDVQTSAGRGEVYSLTVVRLHPDPFFAARVPYVVAIIQFDEGFRMLGEIVAPVEDVSIGSRVQVEWDDSQPVSVPLFVLAAGNVPALSHECIQESSAEQ
jgi:uncharacterized OB-fold protein